MWTNRNVYNLQKVQPPQRGYESAPGYGNHATYLVMSILEHVAQSQLCDLSNIWVCLDKTYFVETEN